MSMMGFPTKEREKDDFYATPEWATQALVDVYGLRMRELLKDNLILWEPACGNGAMTKVLEPFFLEGQVISSDLVHRGHGNTFDFLSNDIEAADFGEDITLEDFGGVVTNPPFKLAKEFILKAVNLPSSKFTCMFLRLSFLEGQKRKKLFEEHPPKYVYVFSKRVSFGRGDSEQKKMNAVAYAWFVWETGFKGETTVRWI